MSFASLFNVIIVDHYYRYSLYLYMFHFIIVKL
jgi:hypothetical protein